MARKVDDHDALQASLERASRALALCVDRERIVDRIDVSGVRRDPRVVVGFSDYVIRPRLVGDEGMPAVLTFLALFGGLEVLGLPGLIAGPVLMALAVAVLRLYAREVRS